MITIIVARPPADKTGPVIYDPLICSEPVAVRSEEHTSELQSH